MTHTIIITETYIKYVEIDADSEEKAIETAKQQYDSGEIIVDWENITDIDFQIDK